MVAIVGFEPTTLRPKGVESTNSGAFCPGTTIVQPLESGGRNIVFSQTHSVGLYTVNLSYNIIRSHYNVGYVLL